MQQAEMKGSSAKPAGQIPTLDDFRGRPIGPVGGFGCADSSEDKGRTYFYGINGGASVGRILGEIGCLMDVVEKLAISIAERVDGEDPTAAQLAYAVMRFAEQANELSTSAIGAKWVQP